ncbi:unnamed protein product [Rangifer tarandus platyrhynchus]|uniref:Olfactory receptor n=1 Tax=Rangifer tarandus platyrhynchus TaxID=3082113 RepID=A0ABN8ZV36_RANTA|nr:unnamed protein product [Rangifer tarandus platyrhynchus]
MSNQTLVTEFVLQGFSEHPEYSVLFFSCFLSLYFVALAGNILIILAIAFNPGLHTPMYFFLFNLATMDIICTSSVIPKALEGLVLEENSISYGGCMAQLYFLTWAASSELLLLTVMAYDRYAAICHPLHYSTMMSKAFCGTLAASVFLLIFLCCSLSFIFFTGMILRVSQLSFCGPNIISHFFCDLGSLIHLSCSDTRSVEIHFFFVTSFVILLPLIITIIAYSNIVVTILRLPSAKERQKAFSTCSSHLIVLSLMYGSCVFIYLKPKQVSRLDSNREAALVNTVVTPLLNPVIYTLRNKQVHQALRDTLSRVRLKK